MTQPSGFELGFWAFVLVSAVALLALAVAEVVR